MSYVTIAQSAVAALLLHAALGKAVSPEPLLKAMAEVAGPRRRSWLVPGLVRAIAAVEAAIAVALILSPTRGVGSAAALGLGISFTILGLLGVARRSSQPCGCLGLGKGRPLGVWNISAGLGISAVVLLAAVGGPSDGTSQSAAVVAAVGMMSLSLFLMRERVKDVLHFFLVSKVSPEGG
jgi:hypothetical protein